jgi:hypothetical protein
VDRARRLGSRRMLLLGLLLAHRFFGADLPDDVLGLALRNPAVVGAAETVVRRAVSGNRTITDSYRVSLYFKMDDTLLEKAKRCRRYLKPYLRLILPSEDDRNYLRSKAWPSAVAYLIRPLRLVAKYATAPRHAVAKLKEWFGSME